MPIYEYRCPKCRLVFERSWQDMNSIPAIRLCPDCGEPSPKIYSNFSFGFSPYLRELREGNMLDY